MRSKNEIMCSIEDYPTACDALVEAVVDVRDMLSCIDDRLEQLVEAVKGGKDEALSQSQRS